jgi:hydroxymethylpyrimidine/phosphomethylpyrimidine kinase
VKQATERKVALTIAGSDPGGGAGVQADLKTFAALHVYGYSAITAVIAQNSAAVKRVAPVDSAMVAAQIEAVVAERPPDAIKTGALGAGAIVEAIADSLTRFGLAAPVVDPVLISTSGTRLLDRDGERALLGRLFPLARVVTPNLAEAQALSGIEGSSAAAIRDMARALCAAGAQAVLIKGGHLNSPSEATDLLYDGHVFTAMRAARIAGDVAHGMGCALSAAIAAYLALGMELVEAVRGAKQYVAGALRASFKLSPVSRPLLDHFAHK